MENIILASASPRRAKILKDLEIKFKAVPSNIEELNSPNVRYKEIIRLNSENKAGKVAEEYQDKYVVGVDTAVVIDGKMLGKPSDRDQAERFLRMLSGKPHRVISSICLELKKDKIKLQNFSETIVCFKNLSDVEIDWYIKNENPYDKAGGYGIQGKASLFTEKIEGCYFNVVGFPVSLFYSMSKKTGLNIFE